MQTQNVVLNGQLVTIHYPKAIKAVDNQALLTPENISRITLALTNGSNVKISGLDAVQTFPSSFVVSPGIAIVDNVVIQIQEPVTITLSTNLTGTYYIVLAYSDTPINQVTYKPAIYYLSPSLYQTSPQVYLQLGQFVANNGVINSFTNFASKSQAFTLTADTFVNQDLFSIISRVPQTNNLVSIYSNQGLVFSINNRGITYIPNLDVSTLSVDGIQLNPQILELLANGGSPVSDSNISDSNISAINTKISNISLQQVYNQSTPDASGSASIILNNKNFRIYGENSSTVYFEVNAQTGLVSVAGDVNISGSTSVINSTVIDEDHLLLSPSSASTVALQINPETTLTSNAVQVAVTNNGPNVFTIGANGTTTITALTTIGNTQLGNTNSSTVKTYYNTLDDGSGNATIVGTLAVTGAITGSLSGNASTASALQNSVTIATSGDATGSASFNGSSSITIPLTLATTGVTAGSYGSSTNIPQITIDSKGRITSATNATVSIPSGSINVTGTDLTMSGTTGADITNATLATTGVTAGTYGNTNNIPQITIDAKGRITSAKNTAISVPSGSISVTGSDLTMSGTTGADITNATLVATGVTAGSYGSSTNIPQITVDSKGRVTSAANVAVSIPSGSISVTGSDLTMSGTTGTAITNATLTATGVTAGTYGNGTNIPQITVDSKGRITNVTTVAASGSGGSSSISVTGSDLTMSGTTGTAITNATLATTGVTAGTYNNSATQITPITVDAKGRITATGSAVTITPAWSSITGTPTTLAGYGITDGAPINNPTFTGTVTTPTLSVTGSMSVAGNTSLTGAVTASGNTSLTGAVTATGNILLANVNSGTVTPLVQIKNSTTTTLDNSSLTYASRFYSFPIGNSIETAAIYSKVDPIGSTDHQIAIYGEITSNQQDGVGAFMKVIHYGAGDAIYVPMFGNGGVGFEAASFVNGSRGILSTIQVAECAYSTLFNCVWGQPTVPLYGMFYADQAPGNAFTIRKLTGASDNQTQIRIWEPDISRTRFEVYNNGDTRISGVAATSTTTIVNSSSFHFRGSYWNGSQSSDLDFTIQNIVSSVTPNYRLSFQDNSSNERMVIQNTGNVGIGTITPSETLDVVGNIQLSGALKCNLITTLTGTTAGSVKWSQYMQGQFKAFAAQFLGYENNSTTSQTITFPTSFVNTPAVVTNTTGLTITVTTTTLTIGAPNNTTAYNGIIEVKGF